MIRPVGNGVIRGARICSASKLLDILADRSNRTLRDGLSTPRSQAFHAWLPSSGPYGTTSRFAAALAQPDRLIRFRGFGDRFLDGKPLHA